MINSYEQALNYIHTRTRFGSQTGLHRIRELMKRLGDPQKGMQFVHIAGTNGKGSVTAMTAEILQRSGYVTGRYVSPYILEFRERMTVNGEMISKELLVELTDKVAAVSAEMEKEGLPPTEFETVTAIAFCFFARMGCEIVALEVGLGGNYDATNVIEDPVCCAITSIGLDHTAILGDTVEQIAGEKAGILKPNVPVVCGAGLSAEALGVIYQKAAEKGCSVIFPNRRNMQLDGVSLTGTDFTYQDKPYHTALIGVHQMENTVTVLEICKVLQSKGFMLSKAALEEGLAQVYFPARMQLLSKAPIMLLDGGHNPQGIEALTESLKYLGYKKAHLVIGMMKDKDCSSVVKMLKEIAVSVRAVTVNDMPRAMKASELAEMFGDAVPVEDLKTAIEEAKADCREDEIVLICGSLYLAEQVIRLMEEKSFERRACYADRGKISKNTESARL